jgi:sugar-specific transcriptional regulator TrmB
LPFNKEETLLLTQVGFTTTQAKIYLTLLQLKEPDAKAVSKTADVPKPEVYRTLNELQKMGLAERQITKPIKYLATPLQFGLQILMAQRVQQCKKNSVGRKTISPKPSKLLFGGSSGKRVQAQYG